MTPPRPAGAREPPASSTEACYAERLARACSNFEGYYKMPPGTANIDLLRQSPFGISAWASYQGQVEDRAPTEDTPRLTVPYGQNWTEDLKVGLRVGVPSYKQMAICTNNTGDEVFK